MDGSTVHLTCTDVYTFPVLQLWTICVTGTTVQSMFFTYISFVTWTHMLSYSPNTTLCSVQSFEDNSIHYGTGFHHSICGYSRIQHTTYHFQSSVIDLYVAETDLISIPSSPRTHGSHDKFRYLYYICQLFCVFYF